MENGLLEILKKNPNLSLSYTPKVWFLTGNNLRNIVFPKVFEENGYQMSDEGIYKEVDGKKKFFAMFCLD